MTHSILICAKLNLASPSPNIISSSLEFAEDLWDFRGPKTDILAATSRGRGP